MKRQKKIVKILGGLGNQMFQYALYTALQRHHPEAAVMADLHTFHGYRRPFQLENAFGIRVQRASYGEVARVAYPYPDFQSWRVGSRLLPKRRTMCVEPRSLAFVPDAVSWQGSVYYDGYWQHEAYFSDCRATLLEQFRFPAFDSENNLALAARLRSEETVAVHVRRTDYVGNPMFHDLCASGYYAEAIRHIRQHTGARLFCIFSDDAAWCKAQLQPLLDGTETIFVDWNSGERSVQDMHLMTLCRHHVTANSSFSWWGAWLAAQEEAVNIGPRLWWRQAGTASPVPTHWLTI